MRTNIIQSMKRELHRRRYSPRTTESYIFCIKKFLDRYDKDPRKITKKNVKDYLDYLDEKNRAGSTMNLYLCAIRFLFGDVLHRNLYLNIKYSRRPKRMPVFLNRKEVRRLFDATENQKHKLMLELMYSAGLRVSEMLNLRVRDFEFHDGYGWVRKGKGNKDRPFVIADKLKPVILDRIKINKLNHNDFLFKGLKGNHMHVSSADQIIKKAGRKAGIKKNVHCHMLRHSYATHLAEDGHTASEIQALLGHSSVQTSMIYVHMVGPRMLSVKSPFDNL